MPRSPEVQAKAPVESSALWPYGTLLERMADDDLRELLRIGTRRMVPRGVTLIHEAATDRQVYVILDGCVKVLGDTPEGRTTLLAIRVAGDIIGELAALDGRPRSATVVTAVPTEISGILPDAFGAFLTHRPTAAAAVHRNVTAKLRQATRFRIDLTGASIQARLTRVLCQLAEGYGRRGPIGVAIDVPLSQAEIASLVGGAEASVHRAFTELRQRGLLSVGYRRLVVHDLPALQALALEEER